VRACVLVRSACLFHGWPASCAADCMLAVSGSCFGLRKLLVVQINSFKPVLGLQRLDPGTVVWYCHQGLHVSQCICSPKPW
jgi:hypothetical protein